MDSAAYVAANDIDVAKCRRLARATVDHERKEELSKGFGEEPGDVLAFAEYRDVRGNIAMQGGISRCSKGGAVETWSC